MNYNKGLAECSNCGYAYGRAYCPNCNSLIILEKCKDGICFITTAVCSIQNKPDDCPELTLLRNFRDNWLLKQKRGQELIKEYYEIAPEIVKSIDNLENKESIYTMIYEKYIQPCIVFIESNKENECMDLYKNMVYTLKQEYIATI